MPGCLAAFIARVLLSVNTRATDKTFNRLLHSDFLEFALALLGVALPTELLQRIAAAFA